MHAPGCGCVRARARVQLGMERMEGMEGMDRSDSDDREARARANRAAMPETAAIVADYRRVFGAGVRLLWAVENGRELGRGPRSGGLTDGA